MKKLIEIVKEHADGFKIVNVKTKANEFFFIKHRLDMNRFKEVEHTFLTVYRQLDDGKFLGSTTREIHPNTSDEQLLKLIQEMNYGAGFVKNPYYQLAKPQGAVKQVFIPIDPLSVASDIIDTIQSVKTTDQENINSYEVFVNEKVIKIINSEGIDVEYETIDSQTEIIVNAKMQDSEIEIYRNYTFGTCDKAYLAQQLQDTITIGKDRSLASKTPNLNNFRVVFDGHNAVKLLGYFVDMTNASSVYMKISDYIKGQAISDNDKISLTALASLPNSSKNVVYDDDGNLLCDKELIKNSVCLDFWGNEQFSQYLGQSKASIYRNFAFNIGDFNHSALRKRPYLRAAEFSDFQCDSSTGNFAGEIRLAYYFDGEKEIPVSGGSISGNIKQLLSTMRLADKLKQIDNYLIPEFIVLDDVSVSGTE